MIINPYRFGQPLLLDIYPNAAVAYSVRKLRTAYSGAALRVRRSSDNAESDIGFVSNQLDTASLLSFVGAGNGFVTTWYDQSGNGENITQTTAAYQPRIVNAGVLEIISGVPSIKFDGTDDFMYVNVTNRAQPIYYSIVSTQPNIQYRFIFESGGTGTRISLLTDNFADQMAAFANILIIGARTLTVNQRYLYTGLMNGVNSFVYTNNNLYINGDLGTNSLNDIRLAAWSGGANVANINIQEFIIYPSNQSANRNAINTNINSYFNIYP